MTAFAMGIGGTEILVVLVLALLLFSPRELPGILRSVMKFWGSIKRTADEFKDTIMQEEALQDIREAYDGTKSHLRKAQTDARRELNKARSEVRKAQSKLAKATKVKEQAAALEAAKAEAAPTDRPAAPNSDPAKPAAAEAPSKFDSVAKPASTPATPKAPPPPKTGAPKSGGDDSANQGAA